jgi:hypothetical protein
VIGIVLIAGASEGRLLGLGLLRPWARVMLFAAGLLVAFPNWETAVLGGALAAAVVLLRAYSEMPEPKWVPAE